MATKTFRGLCDWLSFAEGKIATLYHSQGKFGNRGTDRSPKYYTIYYYLDRCFYRRRQLSIDLKSNVLEFVFQTVELLLTYSMNNKNKVNLVLRFPVLSPHSAPQIPQTGRTSDLCSVLLLFLQYPCFFSFQLKLILW